MLDPRVLLHQPTAADTRVPGQLLLYAVTIQMRIRSQADADLYILCYIYSITPATCVTKMLFSGAGAGSRNRSILDRLLNTASANSHINLQAHCSQYTDRENPGQLLRPASPPTAPPGTPSPPRLSASPTPNGQPCSEAMVTGPRASLSSAATRTETDVVHYRLAVFLLKK